MYAIHLPWSSLFCEQAVYRQGEGSLVLWRKRTSSHEDGAGKREGMSLHLWTSGWRERASCPLLFVPVSWIVSSLTRSRQSSLLGACRKALLSGAGRQANALTGRTREHPQGMPSGWQISRHAGQSPRHSRVRSFRPSLQKNRPGRLCGAWLPRKKTL